MNLPDGVPLLRQGEWDRAHRIAQVDATRLGSWLHGILHMVEPAEGNTRFWYRAVGRLFPGLGGLASERGESGLAV